MEFLLRAGKGVVGAISARSAGIFRRGFPSPLGRELSEPGFESSPIMLKK
jgi:hypothetical protein